MTLRTPSWSSFTLELKHKPSAQQVSALGLLDWSSFPQLSQQQSHKTCGSESGSFVYHDASETHPYHYA